MTISSRSRLHLIIFVLTFCVLTARLLFIIANSISLQLEGIGPQH